MLSSIVRFLNGDAKKAMNGPPTDPNTPFTPSEEEEICKETINLGR